MKKVIKFWSLFMVLAMSLSFVSCGSDDDDDDLYDSNLYATVNVTVKKSGNLLSSELVYGYRQSVWDLGMTDKLYAEDMATDDNGVATFKLTRDTYIFVVFDGDKYWSKSLSVIGGKTYDITISKGGEGVDSEETDVVDYSELASKELSVSIKIENLYGTWEAENAECIIESKEVADNYFLDYITTNSVSSTSTKKKSGTILSIVNGLISYGNSEDPSSVTVISLTANYLTLKFESVDGWSTKTFKRKN